MKNQKVNFLVPVIIGATVGAVLGILFAPDKGESTRRTIKKKVSETAHDLSEQIVHAKDEITRFTLDKKVEIEKKLETQMSNLSYKAENIINKLEDKLEELKEKTAKLHK